MENIKKQSKGLSGSTLKIIAIVTMLIDHIGATIVENMVNSYAGNEQTFMIIYNIMFIMRSIGRLAFPIFCFLLVEGFFHTRDVKKYVFRLFLFALISEVPFDYAFNQSFLEFTSQNVFFTLFIGVLMLWAIEYIKTRFNGKNAVLIILIALVVVVASLLADFIKCDYSSLGIIVILLMYAFKNNKLLKTVSISFAFAFLTSFSLQTLAALAFIPISFYNGKKGLSLKYFFYAFYPVHLFILGSIVRLIM
jgi:hypothetical protein